jgi:hypothetical protein
MRESLLSVASPEFLSWLGFLLLAAGLLGEVAVLVEPFENHWTHKPLGFACAAIVLVGYVIGHIGDDAITAGFAERAKIAEAKLTQLGPRRLTEELSRKMSSLLTASPSTGVAIVSRLMDGEGGDFADDLASVLKKSHWETARFSNWTRPDKGIFIATVEGTTPAPEVGALIAALDAANIQHNAVTIGGEDLNRMSPAFQPRVLYLLVGAKP